MRTLTVLLATLLVAATAHALPEPQPPQPRAEPDGLTARTTLVGAPADLVFTRTADGSFVVAIALFQKTTTGWEQASMTATLRAFVTDPVNGDQDVLSKPFRSSATRDVLVTIPGGIFERGDVVDLFVTFSSVGGNPVPTSHHSVAKNLAIAQGDLDAADRMDYHHVVRPTVV